MDDYKLKLSPPAFIVVETSDGSKSARIDVYKARRFLEEASKQANEEQRWVTVTKWLADKLAVQPDELAENVAWEFHECVAALVQKIRGVISEQSSSIASSQQPILESPTDSQAGQLS